jgi:hypothetical protein
MVVIFSNKFISKSILGFQFWTFINVHFQKPGRSFEKKVSEQVCDDNALKSDLVINKSVMIIFLSFYENYLGIFYVLYL